MASGLWQRLRALTWMLQPCLASGLKSTLRGAEESSLPPQGSDIRGIKQETGSKSPSSSLSRLLHKRVPPGGSRGCSTTLPDLAWPRPWLSPLTRVPAWAGSLSKTPGCGRVALLRGQRASAAFGVLWVILQSRGLLSAESPDCGSSGGRVGGRWALGLIHSEKALCLPPIHPRPHCPLGIAANHLVAELAPGREERRFLLPQPSLPLVLPGASLPQFLQNEAAAPVSPSCPLLVPVAAPLPGDPEPSSPSPPRCGSACFSLASSSSPHATVHSTPHRLA